MKVLDDALRSDGPRRAPEEVAPGDSQALHGRQRMQVARDVEPDRQSEDLAGTEPLEDLLA